MNCGIFNTGGDFSVLFSSLWWSGNRCRAFLLKIMFHSLDWLLWSFLWLYSSCDTFLWYIYDRYNDMFDIIHHDEFPRYTNYPINFFNFLGNLYENLDGNSTFLRFVKIPLKSCHLKIKKTARRHINDPFIILLLYSTR
jgi:hypothetical protein